MEYQRNPEQGKPIPQLENTGVSGDYFNAIYALFMLYKYEGGINAVADFLLENPIARYTERFPPFEFKDVVTSLNRAAVFRLDEIANELNHHARTKTLGDECYRLLQTEACKLIYGQQHEVDFD
jgi:hypothetical protein